MSQVLLVVGTLSSGLAVGLVPTLVDSVKLPLKERLALPENRVEGLLRCFYLLWLPGMPLAGWLLDHGDFKLVFFFGLLGAVLGIAWLALVQTIWSLVGSILVLGLAYSAFATATIRLMPDVLHLTSHSSAVAALNVGFIFVALGSIAGPWVVQRLQRAFGYRQGLLYLSFTFIVPAALVMFTQQSDLPEKLDRVAWAEVLLDARLWLLGGVILLYFAIENCLEFWPSPYLVELGFHGRRLAGALLLFWGVFMLARLGMGWLPAGNHDVWVLLGLLLIAGMSLGNLVGAREYSSGSFGLWLTGACYGPLLPGLLALVILFFPHAPGTALGVMLSLSGLDTIIMRPLMTALAKRHPTRTVMAVPAVLALVMAAPLLILALIRGM